MIATGNPRIKEKMDLDIQVAKLKMLKSNHVAQRYETEDMIIKHFPQKMAEVRLFIEALSADLPILEAHPVKEDAFSMTILGKTYTERKEAGLALVKACKTMPGTRRSPLTWETNGGGESIFVPAAFFAEKEVFKTCTL